MGSFTNGWSIVSNIPAVARWGILLLAMSVFVSVASSKNAFTQDNTLAKEAAAFANWGNEVNEIYGQLMEVLKRTASLDETSMALLEGNVTESFARRTGIRILVLAKNDYEKLRKHIDCCLETPNFENRVYSKVAPDTVQFLHLLMSQALGIMQNSSEIFLATLDGDEAVAGQLQAHQFRRWTLLLESENVFIGTQQLLVDESHPQFSLLSAIAHGNSALVTLLGIFQDNSLDHESVEAIVSMIRVEQEVLRMKRVINDGRKTVLNWYSTIDELRSENVAQIGMIRALEGIMENYAESFDVEEEIAGRIGAMTKIDISSTSPTADNIVETEFLAIELLADRRMALQSLRLKFLEGISEFMR